MSYKIEIKDYMYNNNYKLNISYKKKVIEYYLELE